MIIIFHTPPPFCLCTPPSAPFESITVPGPLQISAFFVSQVSVVVYMTACLCVAPHVPTFVFGYSETFSFMLTGEDGSRRFGYCRRLLVSHRSAPCSHPRRAPVCCDRRFHLDTRCSFPVVLLTRLSAVSKRKEIIKNNNVFFLKKKICTTWKPKLGVKQLKKTNAGKDDHTHRYSSCPVNTLNSVRITNTRITRASL